MVSWVKKSKLPASVFVKETWAKEEAPDQEYEKRKHYEALKLLMMELKRRVLAGELLLSVGKNYWRSKSGTLAASEWT